MPYLLFLKKHQNLKLSSAANYRWCFKGSMTAVVLQVCGEVHRILALLSMTVIATKIKLLRGLVSYPRYISGNFIRVVNPERAMVKAA